MARFGTKPIEQALFPNKLDKEKNTTNDVKVLLRDQSIGLMLWEDRYGTIWVR